jgi:hypothetical protein
LLGTHEQFEQDVELDHGRGELAESGVVLRQRSRRQIAHRCAHYVRPRGQESSDRRRGERIRSGDVGHWWHRGRRRGRRNGDPRMARCGDSSRSDHRTGRDDCSTGEDGEPGAEDASTPRWSPSVLRNVLGHQPKCRGGGGAPRWMLPTNRSRTPPQRRRVLRPRWRVPRPPLRRSPCTVAPRGAGGS